VCNREILYLQFWPLVGSCCNILIIKNDRKIFIFVMPEKIVSFNINIWIIVLLIIYIIVIICSPSFYFYKMCYLYVIYYYISGKQFFIIKCIFLNVYFRLHLSDLNVFKLCCRKELRPEWFFSTRIKWRMALV